MTIPRQDTRVDVESFDFEESHFDTTSESLTSNINTERREERKYK